MNNKITSESLLAKIDLCNNGYIYSPSVEEKQLAHKHPSIFKVALNTVTRTETFLERRNQATI